MAKLLPTAIALALAILSAVTPLVQDYVQAHPSVATYLGSLAVIVANFVKAPR